MTKPKPESFYWALAAILFAAYLLTRGALILFGA